MFHTRLKEMRNKRCFTQRELANLLNIALITYQKYEQGVRNPPFDCLIQMADILNVSIDYLMGRDDFLKSLGVSFDEYQ